MRGYRRLGAFAAKAIQTKNARLSTFGGLRGEGDSARVQVVPAGSGCHQRAIPKPLGETERDQSDRNMVWHDCERPTPCNRSKPFLRPGVQVQFLIHDILW